MPKRTATGRVVRDVDTSDDEQLSDVDEAFLQAHERSMSTGDVTFKREDSDGLSPITVASPSISGKTATSTVRGKAIKRDRGSGVNLQDKTHGRTALHRAAAKGALDKVKDLIEQGADLSIRDNAEVSPLHEAAAKGRLEVVRLLLSKGAAVEPRDVQGDYPLLDAAQNDDIEICRVLLEAGANPTLQNENGCSALSEADEGELKELLRRYSENFRGVQQPKQTQTATAAVSAPEPAGNNSPHDSVDSGTNHRIAPREAKKSLVQMERLGPRRVDASGRDALHNCVLDGDEDALEQWLDIQPCTFTDKDKCTPLHSAARLGHARMCSMLLDKGAKHSARNSIGNTPLHEACFKRDNKLVIQTLLEAHASPVSENAAGLTPLQLARLELGEDAREVSLLQRAATELMAKIAKRQHPGEESEQPRKKRGRPRKHPIVESDTSDQQISIAAVASPVNDSASPAKLLQQNSRQQSPIQVLRTAPHSPATVRNADSGQPSAISTPAALHAPRDGAPAGMREVAQAQALSPSTDLSPVAAKTSNVGSPRSPLRNVVADASSTAIQPALVNGYSTPLTSNGDAAALLTIGTRLDNVTRLVEQLGSQRQAQQQRDEQEKLERQQVHAALNQIVATVVGVRGDVERMLQARPAPEARDSTPQLANAVKGLTDAFERSHAEMTRVSERQATQMDRLTQDTHSYMRTLLYYLQQQQQSPAGQSGYGHGGGPAPSQQYGPGGYAGQQAVTAPPARSTRASVDGRTEATPPLTGNGMAAARARAGSLQPPSSQHYAPQAPAPANARSSVYSPQQQHQHQAPSNRAPAQFPSVHSQAHPHQHTAARPEHSPVVMHQPGPAAAPSVHAGHPYPGPAPPMQHPHQLHRQRDGREYSAERRTPIAPPPPPSGAVMSKSQSPALHANESSLPSLAAATGGVAGHDRHGANGHHGNGNGNGYAPNSGGTGNGWQQKSAAEMALGARAQLSTSPAVGVGSGPGPGSGAAIGRLPAMAPAVSGVGAGAPASAAGHGVHDNMSNVRGSVKLEPPPQAHAQAQACASAQQRSQHPATASHTHANPSAYPHPHASPYAHPHAHAHPQAQVHAHAHPHAASNGNGHGNGNGNGNGNGAGYYDPIRRA